MSKADRSPSPEAIARRRTGKFNILYFSPFPSHPTSHGNRSNIYHFGKLFQDLGHKIYFVLLQSNDYTAKDLEEMQETWDHLDVIPNSLSLVYDGNPIAFDGWYEEGLGERIHVLCKNYDIDMVFCMFIFQSKLLEFVPHHILKVIHAQDKMSNRFEMLRESGLPLEYFSCSPEEEGAYLRRADLVVAFREEEASFFDEVMGRKTSLVIPHY